MKTITWLHISDLHLCPDLTGWDADDILKKLIEDMEKLKTEHGLNPDLIFVTGDMAYGTTSKCENMESQYEAVTLFFGELMEKCDVAAKNLFIVPGNHDVNIEQILDSATDWLGNRDIDEIHDMLQRQDHNEWPGIVERLEQYSSFVRNDLELDELIKSNRVIYSQSRLINDIKVGIAGFNTAWSSCGAGDKEKGQLWFGGEWQIKTLSKDLYGCDIKIGLSHHPFDWAHSSECPGISQNMQDVFDFHLHGHEHSNWIEPLKDAQHCRIAAGALYVPSLFR